LKRPEKIFPFLSWWPTVNRQTLRSDFLAGLTNAFIVLPQGVAFAMIAGLPPVYGLYTAMITPVVAALFGSSHHLVSGPTTALSIAVFSAISPLAQPGNDSFIALTLTLTFIAGLFQFAMGLARLGALVNFVSHSVVMGFTAGAAVLIATSQLKYAVGIDIPPGSSFLSGWQYLAAHASHIDGKTLLLGTFTVAAAVAIRRFLPKMPHLLASMILAGVVAFLLRGQGWEIPTLGSIRITPPPLSLPDLSLNSLRTLAPGALAVALLGLIEAVAIARGIAARSHQRINGSQEFIGQGLSNMVGGMFSCYMGSGSFTRSGVNFTAGARTPLSAVFAAILLLIILLLVAPFAVYLPLAVMGGIIMLVAYNLVDWKHIRGLLRTSKAESAILGVTFVSTLFLGIEFAIFAGIILSLAFYLLRTSQPRITPLAPAPVGGERKFMNAGLYGLTECPQLHVIRIDGSVFFGAVDSIRDSLHQLSESRKHILIVGSGINFIDVSGAEMLVTEAERLRSLGGGLYFSQLKKSVRDYLAKGYREKIGDSNIFAHKVEAIAAIYGRLDRATCNGCTVRVFRECKDPASC
jgi:SulP family sulfate permease